MAWSSPRTWVAGELVTAAIMNTYVRDNQSAIVATTGAYVNAMTGPHAIGGSTVDYVRLGLTGAWESGGASTVAFGTYVSGVLTGAQHDSVAIAGTKLNNSIVTASSNGTCTTIAQLWVAEPQITVGSGTVTNSATVYIEGAASEATNDYALWVDSGVSRFDNFVQVGTTGASAGINSPKSTYFNCDSGAAFSGEVFIWGTNRATTSGGTELMRLTDGGNLGIGTSDPGFLLDVQHAGAARLLSIEATTGTNYAYAAIVNGSGALYWGCEGSSAAQVVAGSLAYSSFVSSNTSDALHLATNGTARMTIAAAGNVGIGTSDPDGTLHVHSGSAGTYAPSAVVDDLTVENSGDAGLNIVNPDASLGNIYFSTPSQTGDAGSLIRWDYTNSLMTVGTNKAGGELQFATASFGDAMRIDASGNVGIQTTHPVATLTVNGSVSKDSSTFRIAHPLPSKKDTHQLVHSIIEGPKADLIYRGTVTLSDGAATVDLDDAAGMTTGTWVLLCRDEQVFTSNETGWQHVRGSVTGSVLTIDCEENDCTDTVSWMVVAERHDQHMYDTEWTDENGRPIIEPEVS